MLKEVFRCKIKKADCLCKNSDSCPKFEIHHVVLHIQQLKLEESFL